MAETLGGSIVWDLSVNDAEFSGRLRDAKNKAQDIAKDVDKSFSAMSDNLGKSFKRAGEHTQDLGRSLITLGAAPTVALVGVVKAAIDFENTFAGVRKTVDATEAEFEQLSDNFREISRITPLAVSDLNRIGEIAGSLGISGVDNLTKFTETIAQVGITSNLTEEAAAMAFGQIANIMQEPIDNIDRMGATVIDLGNKMAATEADITNFAQRIAGAGKIAGLTTSDVFAIGAAMASVGVEAEAGGTAVQKVLIGMTKAVVEGGEDLENFAKTAGYSADAFIRMWKNDPGEIFKDFVEGLGDSGDEAINILSDLGLEDQRLIRAFLSLGNAGELLEQSLGIASDGWRENTALTVEAGKRYATTASQLQIAKNNLNDIGITIGSAILPSLNKLLASLAPVVANFANFADKNPQLLAGLLAVGAAIGVLGVGLFVLGGFISSLGTIIGAFGAITAIALSPVTLAILGIIAISALLYKAWSDNWFGIQEKTQVFISWFQTSVVPIIQAGWATIQTAISTVVTWFNDVALPILARAFDVIKVIVADVMGVFKEKFDFARVAAEGLIGFIRDTFHPDFEKTMNLIKSVIDANIPGWVRQLDTVVDVFGKIANKIGEVIGKIDELSRKATGSGIAGNLVKGLMSMGNIPGFASGIQNYSGGLAVVGERGPEIVNLPQGSDVFSNRKTLDVFSGMNSGRGGQGSGVNVTIGEMNVRQQSDIDSISRELAFRIETSPGYNDNG